MDLPPAQRLGIDLFSPPFTHFLDPDWLPRQTSRMDSQKKMPPPAHDKTLFTPGPLTTSLSVKKAMLHDAGSWHYEFNETVAGIRSTLLEIAGLSREAGFEVILMQGTGTFGVESVFSSGIPPNGKLLILANGAYGERMALMASQLKIDSTVLRSPENEPPDLNLLGQTLASDPQITHVATVHCETTTGILNPIDEIGQRVKAQGRIFILDAISSFGAIPIDFAAAGVDYLISSPNKCLEGVPGFSFVLARRSCLLATEGFARTLSLDLLGQWKGFEKNGQFRYTPPTHTILAFQQALREFADEGGVPGRAARYRRNHEVLISGMTDLGFRPFLHPSRQSYIITSFHYPADSHFSFLEFYRLLSSKGMIIYPGKLTQVDCFRIASIGRIFEADVFALLGAIRASLGEMGVRVPLPNISRP